MLNWLTGILLLCVGYIDHSVWELPQGVLSPSMVNIHRGEGKYGFDTKTFQKSPEESLVRIARGLRGEGRQGRESKKHGNPIILIHCSASFVAARAPARIQAGKT